MKKPIFVKPFPPKLKISKADIKLAEAGPSYDIAQVAKHPLTVKEYMVKQEKVRANDAKDEVSAGESCNIASGSVLVL